MSCSARLQSAIAAMRSGRMVVVVDDRRRENEGDLVMAADRVTPEAVNFMATHARGLICVAMGRDRLDELGIAPMTRRATDPRGTAFHVGVDLRGQSTGISAGERSETIRALADPATAAERFTRPGHVFPLAYQPGGVVNRGAHTEASVDLAGLAGFGPAAVICEIAADDGSMMRLPELQTFAERHRLALLSVSELRDYLLAARPPLIKRVSEARVPLPQGAFTFVGYRDEPSGREHVAAVFGRIAGDSGVLARIHSECLAGDVLRSLRCDCGRQLDFALKTVVEDGAGVVVYLRSDEGEALECQVDPQHAALGAAILADLEVETVRLIRTNPAERAALAGRGIRVIETVGATTEVDAENVRYLSARRVKLAPDIDVGGLVGHGC